MQLIIFFIIFVVNGLGIFPQQINLLMWLLASLVFLIKIKVYMHQIQKLPGWLSVSYILFIGAAFVSTIESVDLLNSLLYIWFYLLLGFVFLEGVFISGRIKKLIPGILLFIGLLFYLYGLALDFGLNTGNTLILPGDGYQLVYAKFTNHNHLGDYLAIVLVLLIGGMIASKKWIIPFILCALALVLSFSRSAYFSFIGAASGLVIFRKTSDFIRWFAFGICLLLVVISLAVAFETKNLPGINSVNYILRDNGLVGGKAFSGSRIYLLSQANNLFNIKPLTGFGLGNYPQAVTLELTGKNLAYTSHNIFADILVETGLLGLLFFTILVISIIRYSSKKSIFFWAAAALLINFQTDYTFRIFGMLLLFAFLTGISVGEKFNGRN